MKQRSFIVFSFIAETRLRLKCANLRKCVRASCDRRALNWSESNFSTKTNKIGEINLKLNEKCASLKRIGIEFVLISVNQKSFDSIRLHSKEGIGNLFQAKKKLACNHYKIASNDVISVFWHNLQFLFKWITKSHT